MGRHKQYDRDEVLERAMKLFWRKGYEGAHLQELVDVTGLNRFSLYKEFGGKEGLFNEAFDRYLDHFMKLVDKLRAEPRGLENIRAYFRGILDFPAFHGCFAVNSLTQHPVIPDESREKVFRLMEDGEKLIQSNLRAARRQGELSGDIEIKAMAKFLMVADLGLFTATLLEKDNRELKKILKPLERLLTA